MLAKVKHELTMELLEEGRRASSHQWRDQDIVLLWQALTKSVELCGNDDDDDSTC
jgi:hypothetical protein